MKFKIQMIIEENVARNNIIDHVAQMVAGGFEELATEENASKSFLGLGNPSKLELNPENPAHKEIQQIGTNMGALVHDIATIPSSDPSRLRKRAFIEGRAQSQFSQESRALEFLIAGILHNGQGGLRGFSHEEEPVQRIIEQSLTQFRAASVRGIPAGYAST